MSDPTRVPTLSRATTAPSQPLQSDVCVRTRALLVDACTREQLASWMRRPPKLHELGSPAVVHVAKRSLKSSIITWPVSIDERRMTNQAGDHASVVACSDQSSEQCLGTDRRGSRLLRSETFTSSPTRPCSP